MNTKTRRRKRRNFQIFSMLIAMIVVFITTCSIINVQAKEMILNNSRTKVMESETKVESQSESKIKSTEMKSKVETETESESEIETETESEIETEYLGEFQITAYCACVQCCGKSDGITASGAYVQEGYTIAVDPSVIPLGTLVMIDGNVYEAQDTGGGVGGNHIDMYMASHSDALQWGVQYKDVYIVK